MHTLKHHKIILKGELEEIPFFSNNNDILNQCLIEIYVIFLSFENSVVFKRKHTKYFFKYNIYSLQCAY